MRLAYRFPPEILGDPLAGYHEGDALHRCYPLSVSQELPGGQRGALCSVRPGIYEVMCLPDEMGCGDSGRARRCNASTLRKSLRLDGQLRRFTSDPLEVPFVLSLEDASAALGPRKCLFSSFLLVVMGLGGFHLKAQADRRGWVEGFVVRRHERSKRVSKAILPDREITLCDCIIE